MTTAVAAGRPIGLPQNRVLAQRQQVHLLARMAFWTIVILSMTNAIGLVITYIRNVQNADFMLGLHPVLFAVCAVLVLAFTKGRYRSAVLITGWIFWILYFLGGFLGPMQIHDFRAVLQLTVKPWITVVGFPWLAMRAISADKAARFIHATVLISAVGAASGLTQLFVPGFLRDVGGNYGRATGFWVDPNVCSVICSVALFLSLACPFRRKWLNLTVRLLLIACVGATFSRAGIATLVLSWIVYAVATKRFSALFKSLAALSVFVVCMVLGLELVEAVSPQQAQRLSIIRAFVRGDFSDNASGGRIELWQQTVDKIVEGGGIVFGLGHGSMMGIVETDFGGLFPHNYYLMVWGSSGLLALVALLFFHFMLFQQGWRCSRPELRAGLIAIATVLAINHIALDALVDRPYTGVLFACIAIAACYGREQPDMRRRFANRPQGPYALQPQPAGVPTTTIRGVSPRTPPLGDGPANGSNR